jgi:hypothetical protein
MIRQKRNTRILVRVSELEALKLAELAETLGCANNADVLRYCFRNILNQLKLRGV